jgi:tetratricopeptide (TPR) repeat protein
MNWQVAAHYSSALVVLTAALVWTAACGSEPDPAQARIDAHTALADGNVSAARRILAQLRGSVPDDPDGVHELSALMVRAGQAPEALWLLEEGIRNFPDHAGLKVLLGGTALVVGNPVRARAAVESVGRESPKHLEALLVHAQAELALGDLERALELLATAQELYPDSDQVRTTRIGTLLRENRLDDATAVIDAARESADADEWIRLELIAATIESSQGKLDAAHARLLALNQRQPSSAEILLALVNAKLRLERADEARDLMRTEIERDPTQASLYAILARVLIVQGEFDAAESSLVEFARLSDTPAAFSTLAQFYRERGQPDLALATNADSVARFPESTAARIYLAENLIESDLVAAERELARLTRAVPDDPQLEYLRARITLAKGDARQAVETLRHLVSRLDHAHTQYWLGRALEQAGDIENAERRYGLALLRDGSHAAGAVELMRLAQRRSEWDAVATHALAWVRRAPANQSAYGTAITALVRAGELASAERLAREYRLRFSDDARSAALISFVLRTQNRLDEAESELTAAQREVGEHPELLAELGMIAAARGQLPMAEDLLVRAVQRSPNEARHHASLGTLQLLRGDSQAGSRSIDRALELDPEQLAPLELRARYRAAKGDWTGARSDCETVLRTRPHNSPVHFMLGVVLTQLGEIELAIESYRRAIEADPREVAPRNNLALLLAERGDLEAALDVAQQAYGIADSNPDVIDTLGWLYLESGLHERSVGLLKRAHESAPADPTIRYHLAIAYVRTDRRKEARDLLSGLVAELDSHDPMASDAAQELARLGE